MCTFWDIYPWIICKWRLKSILLKELEVYKINYKFTYGIIWATNGDTDTWRLRQEEIASSRTVWAIWGKPCQKSPNIKILSYSFWKNQHIFQTVRSSAGRQAAYKASFILQTLFLCFVFLNRSQNINILSGPNNFFSLKKQSLQIFMGGRAVLFRSVLSQLAHPATFHAHTDEVRVVNAAESTQSHSRKEEQVWGKQQTGFGKGSYDIQVYAGTALEIAAHSFSSGKGEELGRRSVEQKKKKWKLMADLKYKSAVNKEELGMSEVTTTWTLDKRFPTN